MESLLSKNLEKMHMNFQQTCRQLIILNHKSYELSINLNKRVQNKSLEKQMAREKVEIERRRDWMYQTACTQARRIHLTKQKQVIKT